MGGPFRRVRAFLLHINENGVNGAVADLDVNNFDDVRAHEDDAYDYDAGADEEAEN